MRHKAHIAKADLLLIIFFTLHSIIQKRAGGIFYVAFIDFSRAFDSVPHSVLWYRMLHEGVHGKIFTAFKSMYAQLKSCVKTPHGLSDLFVCTVGTRQGCISCVW